MGESERSGEAPLSRRLQFAEHPQCQECSRKDLKEGNQDRLFLR